MSPPEPRPEDHRLLLRIGTAAAVGIAFGIFLIVGAGQLARPRTDEVRLLGRQLPADVDASEIALGWMRKRIGGWFNLDLPDGGVRRVSYRALGVEIDDGRLRQLARDVRDESSPWSRLRKRSTPGPVELLVPLRLDLERALPTLLALKDELDRGARDARLDLDHQSTRPERAGRLLDVDRSLRDLEDALRTGAESAPLAFEYQTPRRLATQLTDIRHDVLIGFFETPYDPAERARDRGFNLRLAASRLDGYVLFPGDELDFNAVVGPRDEANGYRVAPVIARGELVDGIGGSTCQISGTLHAAALFAGLDIVERHPHARPSSYIKLGFDAAVLYPTINFRVRNPYEFPVVLRETVKDGRVRAEVRGARRPHTITVIRKIDAARPFEEIRRADDALPKGRRVLAQRGVPGIDLHRHRIRRDGAHAVRETTMDRYPPTAQLVLYGVGSELGKTGRPPHDVAPEYLADELLVISQGAPLDAPLLEQRTPGRYGTAGWTKNIGEPAAESRQ
jgi:vancomycin resistance protein YoaR